MRQTITSIIVTMIGVILAIYAAESRVRLDWPETALVAAAVLVTIGIVKLKEGTKGEQRDDLQESEGQTQRSRRQLKRVG